MLTITVYNMPAGLDTVGVNLLGPPRSSVVLASYRGSADGVYPLGGTSYGIDLATVPPLPFVAIWTSDANNNDNTVTSSPTPINSVPAGTTISTGGGSSTSPGLGFAAPDMGPDAGPDAGQGIGGGTVEVVTTGAGRIYVVTPQSAMFWTVGDVADVVVAVDGNVPFGLVGAVFALKDDLGNPVDGFGNGRIDNNNSTLTTHLAACRLDSTEIVAGDYWVQVTLTDDTSPPTTWIYRTALFFY